MSPLHEDQSSLLPPQTGTEPHGGTAQHGGTGHPATRRAVLARGTAIAAVLAGFSRRLQAQGTPAGPHTRATHQRVGDLRLLVDRITNGWTQATWDRATTLGYSGFLEEQLAYESIPEDPALLAQLAAFPTLTMTSKQLYDTYVVPNQTNLVTGELKVAAVLRGMYSTRQLFERMVEFWTDHFNVDHAEGQVQWLKTTEDRDLIRVHALGRFGDLLRGDARSAAMLYYLDNYRNFAQSPNENYSREAMELHSLSVGHYTEADVVALARILTGWQYRPIQHPSHGDFYFNAAVHDNAAKTFLGTAFPAGGGEAEGLTALNMLANHRLTAEFVSRKMIRWLLTYEPSQSVVDQVASVFLSSGGDIKATIRAIFDPGLVAQVPAADLPKIKRPFHLVCSMARACAPTITNPSRFVNELALMGHRPFSWPDPNGYPETPEAWGQSVLARWTFVTRFVDGQIAGTNVNIAALFSGTPKSALAERASEILSGGMLDPVDVAAVQAYANSVATLNDTLRRDVLELAAQSPSFQYV